VLLDRLELTSTTALFLLLLAPELFKLQTHTAGRKRWSFSPSACCRWHQKGPCSHQNSCCAYLAPASLCELLLAQSTCFAHGCCSRHQQQRSVLAHVQQARPVE